MEPRLVGIDNGETICLRVGERAQIVCPENPSTGYLWTASVEGDGIVTLDDDGYKPSESVKMSCGSGGTHKWFMTALRVGRAVLQLQHRRAWEREPIELQEASIVVVENNL